MLFTDIYCLLHRLRCNVFRHRWSNTLLPPGVHWLPLMREPVHRCRWCKVQLSHVHRHAIVFADASLRSFMSTPAHTHVTNGTRVHVLFEHRPGRPRRSFVAGSGDCTCHTPTNLCIYSWSLVDSFTRKWKFVAVRIAGDSSRGKNSFLYFYSSFLGI